MKLLSILFAIAACIGTTVAGNAQTQDPDAVNAGAPVTTLAPETADMTWIGKAVDDPDYYVWCTSPIQSDDGKIHLFCSRWPKKHGMGGWMTHSEIAHYVGKKPEGPFRFHDLAIPAKPDAPWLNSIHNPFIGKVGNKYLLLFISFDRRPGGDGKMLTALATAKSLNGPWKLEGDKGLMFKPSPDPKHWTYKAWAMDNPAFIADPVSGKYFIYFKASPQQRDSRYGYAVADKLEGPYTLSDAPCTDNKDYIEDANAFMIGKKYYLLTNDNYGTHTGKGGRGILWASDTPTDFKLADAKIGFLNTTDYAKNIDTSRASHLYGGAFKFERPGILMLAGKPAYFYGPSGVNLDGDDHTCSYVMKINFKADGGASKK